MLLRSDLVQVHGLQTILHLLVRVLLRSIEEMADFPLPGLGLLRTHGQEFLTYLWRQVSVIHALPFPLLFHSYLTCQLLSLCFDIICASSMVYASVSSHLTELLEPPGRVEDLLQVFETLFILGVRHRLSRAPSHCCG